MVTGLPPDIAILASGGVDSGVLTHLAAKTCGRVQPIYVRFGLSWEEAEMLFLERFLSEIATPVLRPLVVLDEPVRDAYGAHWSVTGKGAPDGSTPDSAVYLPARNLLLTVKPLVWCAMNGYDAIAIGILKENPFRDGRREFFDLIEAAARDALPAPVRVIAPLVSMTKQEVIAAARDIPLEFTLSCIAPSGGKHCGACNKCIERRRAFDRAGIPDRTEYAAGAHATAGTWRTTNV